MRLLKKRVFFPLVYVELKDASPCVEITAIQCPALLLITCEHLHFVRGNPSYLVQVTSFVVWSHYDP